MKQDFEQFLQEKFAMGHPELLDDSLPDAFDNWMGNMSQEKMIDWANLYGLEMQRQTIKDSLKIINESFKNLK